MVLLGFDQYRLVVMIFGYLFEGLASVLFVF